MNDELSEGIKHFKGRARIFLLLRIAGLDKQQAISASGITENVYTNWMHTPEFVQFYRRVDELCVNYRKQAITALRQDNQIEAVLLEHRMIEKMSAEIQSGKYKLVKTPLAKLVYERLLNEMDFQPTIVAQTWNDRRQQFLSISGEMPALPPVTEVSDAFSETDNLSETAYKESNLLQTDKQGDGEDKSFSSQDRS
jgi:hypothetical protein